MEYFFYGLVAVLGMSVLVLLIWKEPASRTCYIGFTLGGLFIGFLEWVPLMGILSMCAGFGVGLWSIRLIVKRQIDPRRRE